MIACPISILVVGIWEKVIILEWIGFAKLINSIYISIRSAIINLHIISLRIVIDKINNLIQILVHNIRILVVKITSSCLQELTLGIPF